MADSCCLLGELDSEHPALQGMKQSSVAARIARLHIDVHGVDYEKITPVLPRAKPAGAPQASAHACPPARPPAKAWHGHQIL